MAELRMRIFSNRDKEQTLEELEEQVNEFLTSVYQVERILQSGGDYFTTITVCYWDRPSLGSGTDASLAELEDELSGASLPGGSAGTGETLSHTHELAAQGVRGLALEEGGTEHPGMDLTQDDLRRSNAEGQFPFAGSEGVGGPGAEENFGDLIAQSLAEELNDTDDGDLVPASALDPATLSWKHACELHALEDSMLTALEKLTAFRAAHPLSGQELIDFLLGEETLVQMVEQVRAASEELGSSLRALALRSGFNPLQVADEPDVAPHSRAALGPGLEGRASAEIGLAGPGILNPAVAQLRTELSDLRRRIDEASRKKNAFVARLKRAIDAQDATQQETASHALERLQRILHALHKRLRQVKEKLSGEIGED